MIQLLSEKFSRPIAFILVVLFGGTAIPARADAGNVRTGYRPYSMMDYRNIFPLTPADNFVNTTQQAAEAEKPVADKVEVPPVTTAQEEDFGGGPSQPEMSSFKSIDINNMVNLFTGDFSYNIPLLDVGGYGVNLFYDGGITMEQEASWVGLGWNLNPGTVTRNMRGVPDDFNGEDILEQQQDMKVNKTWGLSLSGDFEVLGVKDLFKIIDMDPTIGVSFNNKLGPALDLGIKGALGFSIAGKAKSEKTSVGMDVSVGLAVNSRNGLTISPNVSLTAGSFKNLKGLSTGIGLGTSYNSKSGVRQLQISEQMSYNYAAVRLKGNYPGMQPMSANILSTSISFAKPSYVPSVRMPVENEAHAGHIQLGGAIFGFHGSVEAEVYQQVSKPAITTQSKQMVGYLYYEKAKDNPHAVMDFTRLNDNEVTPNTPIISAPQFTYDVFSVQGEGTGGSFRAYRNDLGYVRDNVTRSTDKSFSIGADISPPGHYGGNFNTIQTPSIIREWGWGNHLRNAIGWKPASKAFENVYFRNPGETSVLLDNQFDKIGGTDLVRLKLGGFDAMPTIEPVLEHFSKSNKLISTNSLLEPDIETRKKRSQVISFLTAAETKEVGLEPEIRNYDPVNVLDANKKLNYTTIARDFDYRKAHHISQITIAESDGMQYIYGLPAYSKVQKDLMFTVYNVETSDGLVNISASEPTTPNTAKDWFYQVTTTPAYAHSFLLTGILTPDYVDLTNNGITEDDYGNAVKFNYSKYADHKWRAPHTTALQANFNAGNLSEAQDDKGVISYGERETWYLHSIESKTMIALFTVEARHDGKGASAETGGVNGADNSLKRLKKIDLYNKADLKKNGLSTALPIKTVWFEYSYALCTGTRDNTTGGEGKLTLTGLYFTYNGKDRTIKPKYAFSYGNGGNDNPSYLINASDRWGNYKPKTQNPASLKNIDFPYSVQDSAIAAQNAAAWALKKILLPSGGQIEVTYESDDYAFVQNKRAAVMMEIAGLGPDPQTITNKMYGANPSDPIGFTEYDHVFIKVPESCANATEVFKKYLEGQQQLAFKLAVNMPGGQEFVNCYATVAEYGVYNTETIWVRLNLVDNLTPLTLSSLSYLRERLPGQAFPGYHVPPDGALKQIGDMLAAMFASLKSAFTDPVRYLRSKLMAQTIIPTKTFVRLNDPDGFKYGGGHRVKSVKLIDNLNEMTQQFTSEYGQEYDYYTTETFNGEVRRISSGVASYEPSIGHEENPFTSIVQVTNRLPMGPSSYGAIEMPLLDAFFPAPLVGYSKVTVRSLNRNTDQAKKSRSGIGRQVTEFYTAKDFPVYVNHTSLDPTSDKQEHQASLVAFFYKFAFDSRALSQGFLVETNDMHGKLKSQSSYAENDPDMRVNYMENFYRNTGSRGVDEKFDFVHAADGGVIKEGNMGIDVELMIDTREFSVKSTSMEVQGQADFFPVVFPFWLPFVWPVGGESEDTYRAVTATKVVNYHAVLDSTLVIDKGSMVSTRNLVYDAETGKVVVSRTNNEYDQPIYSVNYSASWAYSGMGTAYKNIGATYKNIDFYNGRLSDPNSVPASLLESGDELYVTDAGGGTSGCITASGIVKRLWVMDMKKNSTALTVPVKDLVFIDEEGRPFTRNDVHFKIIRSGRRNMLSASVGAVSLMTDPRVEVSPGLRKLRVNSTSQVLNASAIEFREKWQIDNDAIKRISISYNPLTCVSTEVIDCNGFLEKRINPYRKGLIGNYRTYRSMVFYGERMESNPGVQTNLPANGFLKDFQLYWDFDGNNNLVPAISNAKWVWNEQATRFNAKGAELETKNALDIYSAAQYGYQKTLPTAFTSNSRYDEMAYEGFEDVDYAETLNNAASNICAKKHIDLTGMSNSQLVNTETAGFNAHSGKYVLGVNANSTASTSVQVKNAIVDNYTIAMETDVIADLYYTGGNITKINAIPSNAPTLGYNFTPGNLSMNLQFPSHNVTGQVAGNSIRYYHLHKTVQYFKITTPNTYSFTLQTDQQDVPLGYPAEYLFNMSYMSVTIKTVSGANVASFSASSNNSPQVSNVFLTCDTYVIETLCSVDIEREQNGPGNGFHAFSAYFNYSSNVGVTSYSSLETPVQCTFLKPVAATDSVMNPVFSVPAQKKMLFSGWVREQCGNPGAGVPCTTSTYSSNQVKLEFNDGAATSFVLQPAGPIIEGWQRYEGEFTAPANATQMTLKLVNNSSNQIWFDDIRIHPFNANMKSYVYDPVNLRLVAELDANNYARYYEYDEEGGLVRTKAETQEGIKTITETRSSQQRNLQTIQ